jgi:hypothetical protein
MKEINERVMDEINISTCEVVDVYGPDFRTTIASLFCEHFYNTIVQTCLVMD